MVLVRVVVAFVAGALVYAIGFALGVTIGDLQSILAIILPPSIRREEIWASSAAMLANLSSFYAFDFIVPKTSYKQRLLLSWCITLTVIAAVYAGAALASGERDLLIYPLCCIMPVGFLYYFVLKRWSETSSDEIIKAGD